MIEIHLQSEQVDMNLGFPPPRCVLVLVQQESSCVTVGKLWMCLGTSMRKSLEGE